MTETQLGILHELTQAFHYNPTMSLHRVLEQARALYQPTMKYNTDNEIYRALRHYNKMRRLDREKYLADQRLTSKS